MLAVAAAVVTLALAVVSLVAILSPAQHTRAPAAQFDGPLMPPGLPAASFSLRDQAGRQATLSEYRGRVLIISFMYSHCRDACPLMATEIRGALDELPDAGREIPVLALSVDPKHDTRRSAAAFLAREQMTGRMRFLLGSRPQLAPIWKHYAIQPGEQHSAYVFLVDRKGLLRVGYPASQLIPEDLAHDLRLLLDREAVGS